MKFFDIQNFSIILDNIIYGIPKVKQVYDELKDDKMFFKYASYAIYKTYFNSPYKAYDEEIRDSMIKKDVFGDENFKIDPKYNLIDEFKRFSSTPSTRLLDAAEEGAEFVISEFKALKDKRGEVDRSGKPLVTADDVLKWMEKIDKALKTLEAAREAVQKEQMTSTKKVRGKSEIGMYEQPAS